MIEVSYSLTEFQAAAKLYVQCCTQEESLGVEVEKARDAKNQAYDALCKIMSAFLTENLPIEGYGVSAWIYEKKPE